MKDKIDSPGLSGERKKSSQRADENYQKELLRGIGEKEKELKEMLEGARDKAGQLIEAAKRKAEELISKARKETPVDMENYMEKELGKVDGQVKEVLEQVDARISKLEKLAAGRMDEAASMIIQAVLPEGDAPNKRSSSSKGRRGKKR